MKSVFSIILLLAVLTVFCETELPEILIEGIEPEKITEVQTGPAKIGIGEEGLKEKTECETAPKTGIYKPSDQYKYLFALGTDIYAKADLSASLNPGKLSVMPVISYKHLFPYLKNRYYENISILGKGSFQEGRFSIKTDIALDSGVYEYEKEMIYRRNYCSLNLNLLYTPSEDISASLEAAPVYFDEGSDGLFISRSLSVKNMLDIMLSPSVKVKSEIELISLQGLSPVYRILILSLFRARIGTIGAGFAAVKERDTKHILPYFSARIPLLSDVFLICENEYGAGVKNYVLPVYPRDIQYSDPLSYRRKFNIKLKYRTGDAEIYAGAEYEEIRSAPSLARTTYGFSVAETDVYPLNACFELVLSKPADLSAGVQWNVNGAHFTPEFTAYLRTVFKADRISLSGTVKYFGETHISGFTLPKDVLYDVDVTYTISSLFGIGAGASKEFVKTDLPGRNYFFVLLKGEF